MSAVNDPLFGALDPKAPGSWNATRSHDGRDVAFDLTIAGKELALDALERALQRVSDLAPLDRAARAAIQRDEDDEDAAANVYYDHHLEELEDADLVAVFGASDRDAIDRDAFLSKLVLVRVGLYPERPDSALLLDYSIGPDVTNYVLCVAFDAEGAVTGVDVES